MRRILHEHGLSIVMFGLFILFWVGQSVAGFLNYNQEQQEHGQPQIDYMAYLRSGAFLEATAENWESEFLQMGAYVLLTALLFQKGSAESKDPDQAEPVDADPREAQGHPGVPWPGRRGGVVLKLYQHSLSLALLLLFVVSFAVHAIGGAAEYSQEQLEHDEPPVSVVEYLRTSRFWFESLQNWQSEFLAVGAIVVLSIFLREQGSPESKPVASPHSQTGSE